MTNLDFSLSLKFQVYQWHKSLGVLLLLAAGLRLLVKLVNIAPPLPHMPKLEQLAARLGHWAFYGFMFALPISGWVMVSASPYGLPTMVFGWFEWPHLPGLEANETVNGLSKKIHEVLAYLFIVMIVLHMSAVIKHWRSEGVNLLPRMGVGSIQKKGSAK